MYVGHALLPLALVALAATRSALDRRQRLAAAALAAGFGVLPDVDLVYTFYAVVRAGPTDVFPTTEHVWTESWVIHRTLTHSLLVGAVVVGIAVASAVAFQADRLRRGEPAAWAPWPYPIAHWQPADLAASVAPRSLTLLGRAGAILGGAALLALAIDADSGLGAITVGLFAGGVVALAWLGVRWRLTPFWIGLAAGTGIGLHPLGDAWMGRPPAPLYPLSTAQLPTVGFAADPTLSFVGAVLVEVLLLCAAVAALQVVLERRVTAAASAWSVLGVVQVAALVLVSPPTFRVAYRFSALLLLIGAVAGAGAAVRDSRPHVHPADRALTGAGAAAGAMLVGVLSYLVAYVALA